MALSWTETILSELHGALSQVDPEQEDSFVAEILRAPDIVCAGAGRVGFAINGFAKRLRHLGKNAYSIGDVTLPHIPAGGLMVLGSGSGETETTVVLGKIAKREGLRIALVTASTESRLAEIADAVVVLNCPSKNSQPDKAQSIQPMTTLFEQALHIYLDSIVLELMVQTGMSSGDMKRLHNAIE